MSENKTLSQQLHYTAAKYILGENIQLKIDGSEDQLKELKNLLEVSRIIYNELKKENNCSIDRLSKLLEIKRKAAKRFSEKTNIIWRL